MLNFNETLIFSTVVFEKSSNIKFNRNPPNESRVVPCGRRTDARDEANSRFFRNFANAPKTELILMNALTIFRTTSTFYVVDNQY
jgi:hypothetical protein